MNTLYPKFKKNLLKGNIDFDTAVIKAYLVDAAAYTYSAAHEVITDVPVGARIATSGAMSSVTISDTGVVDCADFTIASVTGASYEAIVFFVDSGTGSTSWLISYVDEGTNLPRTPDGSAVNVYINPAGLIAL